MGRKRRHSFSSDDGAPTQSGDKSEPLPSPGQIVSWRQKKTHQLHGVNLDVSQMLSEAASSSQSKQPQKMAKTDYKLDQKEVLVGYRHGSKNKSKVIHFKIICSL